MDYAVSISIDNTDFQNFLKEMNKFEYRVREGVYKEIARATFSIDEGAKLNAPVKYGRLRSSIKGRILASKVTGQVDVKVNYAAAVHEGSKPHIIRPKNKKILAWSIGKGKSKVTRFAKSVNHPGTKPNPFLRKAVEKERPVYIANLMKILNEGGK